MDREFAQVLWRAGRMIAADMEMRRETASIPYRALKMVLNYLSSRWGFGSGQTAGDRSSTP